MDNRNVAVLKAMLEEIKFLHTDLKDVAAHGYKVLRFERIWNLIQADIPDLEGKIKLLLGC